MRWFLSKLDSNGSAFVKGSGLSTMLDEIVESESYETRLGDVPWTARWIAPADFQRPKAMCGLSVAT